MSKITVTNTSSSASTKGSLAWAVKQAETHHGADTIVFDKSLKGKTITLSNTLVLTQDTTIKGDINGDHKADIIISGDSDNIHGASAGDVRLFEIGAGATVSLNGLVLKGGYDHGANYQGEEAASAVLNNGTLTISDSAVTGNVAIGGTGPTSYQPAGYKGFDAATILSHGKLTVTNTSFSGNSATGGQGGFGDHDHATNDGAGGGNGGNAASAILQLAQSLTLSGVTLGTGTATGGAGGPGGVGAYGESDSTSGNGGNGGNGGYAASIIVASSISDAPRTASLDTLVAGGAGAAGQPGPDGGGGQGSNGHVGTAGQSATVVLLPGATGNVTLIVTNTNDSGAGSLRDAIARADDGATITFAAGLSGKTIYLQSTLELKHGVTIDGDINNDHVADITLSGDRTNNGKSIDDVAIMQVDSGATTGLIGLNFNGGYAHSADQTLHYAPPIPFAASAIGNFGTLSIVDSTFSGNNAYGGQGGPGGTHGAGSAGNGGVAATIINFGTLAISHSDFGHNAATGGLGGLGGDGALDGPLPQAGTDGGNGGDAAAGILQLSTAANSLSLDRITQHDNFATAGSGNFGGKGANAVVDNVFPLNNGGNAGNGGDGGNSGFVVVADGSNVHGSVSNDLVFLGSGLGEDAGAAGLPASGGSIGLPGDHGDPGDAANIMAVGSATSAVSRLVTNTNDSGEGSLRAAILNSDPGSTIKFADSMMGQTIVLTTELVLAKSLTIDGDIDGDGKADVTLSGDTNGNGIADLGDSGIIDVITDGADIGANETIATLRSLTLTNGFSAVTGHEGGGAVRTGGYTSLTLINSTVSNSYAASYAGGITAFGDVTLVNSTIHHNTGASGGAMMAFAHLTLLNTTVAYNSGGHWGALYTNYGTVELINSTMVDNTSSSSYGGGIGFHGGATVALTNSILAGNTASGAASNLSGYFAYDYFTATNSFLGTDISGLLADHASAILATDIINDFPFLAQLLDNGGPVLTMAPVDAPLEVSLLTDAGSNAGVPSDDLYDLDNNGVTTGQALPVDARGRPRLVGTVDIGAVEQGPNQTITGNDRDNALWEGSGKDTIDGAGGNDSVYYYYETRSVRVTLNGANFADVYVGGKTAAFKQDIIRNVENVVGGKGNDTLTGDGGNNAFAGSAGKDVIDGKGGIDIIDYFDKTTSVKVTLNGSHSASVYIGGTTASKIEDTVKNIENVVGGSGNDTLTGDGHDNQFHGADGKDVIDGGDGVDTADYSGNTTGISVTLVKGAGTVFVTGSLTDRDTLKHIENITGGAGNDTITGDSGNNSIFGGGGADVLDGGGGSDTVDFSDKTADISLDLSFPSFLTIGGATEDTISNFENVVGGAGNDYLLGMSGQANALAGENGNDTLFGRGAAAPIKGVQQAGDSLYGGAGNDTFYLEANSPLGKNAILDGGVGLDTLYVVADFGSRVGYTLDLRSASNLTLSGIEILNMDTLEFDPVGANPIDKIKLNASQLADFTTIEGTSRDDVVDFLDIVMGSVTRLDLSTRTITGFHDYDTLTGGANDTIIITGDSSSERIIGGNGPLYEIHAGGGNDTIGAGADLSLAGFHADILDGGSGNDWVDYSNSEQLTISLLDGTVTDGLVVAHLESIENVIGGDHGNHLIGNDGGNILQGGADGDSIEGGGGNDTLIAGLGVDTLDGGEGNDTASFAGHTASDSLFIYLDTDLNATTQVTIAGDPAGELRNIENLIGGAGGDGLYGNQLANRLSGGDGGDTLAGAQGNDTLDGGAGADASRVFDAL